MFRHVDNKNTAMVYTNEKIFRHYVFSFLFIYILFIKDCFEILLWAFIKLTKRFTWILSEFCNNSPYQIYLEELANDKKEPLFSTQSNSIAPDIKIKTFQQQNENCEIYLCNSCKRRNKSLIVSRYFKRRTPTRGEVRVLPSHNFKKDKNSFQVLHQNMKNQLACKSSAFFTTQKCDHESPTSEKAGCNKIIESPKTSTSSVKNNTFKDDKSKHFVPNHKPVLDSIKFGKSFFESVKQKSFKFNTSSLQRSESQTLPKVIDLKTPPRNGCYIDLETPLSEFSFRPNRNRLKLMLSEEDYKSPTEGKSSIVKRSWDKWRQACMNFKRRNDSKENLISNLDDQRSLSASPEIQFNTNVFGNEPETPAENLCCSNILSKFKNKFTSAQNHTKVVYKSFKN